MNITILYATAGAGHLKAAEAVKEALGIKYPEDNIYSLDGLDYSSKILNKLVVKSYSAMATSLPSMWELFYNAADKQEDGTLTVLNNTLHKIFTMRLKKLFRVQRPNVIVSTHPSLTKMSAYLKKKKKTDAKILVILTDYAVHNMWFKDDEFVDKYIVASEQMKSDAISLGIDPSKIYVTGIPISPEFNKEYDKASLVEYGLKKDKKTILFFCGGGLGIGKSTDMLKDLLDINEDFQVIAIAGKNKKNQETLNEISEKSNKIVKVLGFTDEVPKILNIVDFVITKPGGLTSSECMACKKPMVIINPIPGQEEKNSIYFTNNGLALRVYEGQSLKDVVSIILKNPLREKQLIEMCEQLGKPNAAFDAAKIAHELGEIQI